MMDRLVGRNCIQFVWEGLTPLAIQLEMFDYFILLSSQNPTKHFGHNRLSLTMPTYLWWWTRYLIYPVYHVCRLACILGLIIPNTQISVDSTDVAPRQNIGPVCPFEAESFMIVTGMPGPSLQCAFLSFFLG